MSVEEWRVIPDFDKYEVSSMGRVRNRKTGTLRVLARNTPNGYLRVTFIKDGKACHPYVHRLVAIAFLGKSDGEVDHIDGNKLNNNVENLRWISPLENMRHQFDFPKEYAPRHGSPVGMITDKGIRIFKSMSDAANAVGRSRRAIYNACRDKTKCAGATWLRVVIERS